MNQFFKHMIEFLSSQWKLLLILIIVFFGILFISFFGISGTWSKNQRENLLAINYNKTLFQFQTYVNTVTLGLLNQDDLLLNDAVRGIKMGEIKYAYVLDRKREIMTPLPDTVSDSEKNEQRRLSPLFGLNAEIQIQPAFDITNLSADFYNLSKDIYDKFSGKFIGVARAGFSILPVLAEHEKSKEIIFAELLEASILAMILITLVLIFTLYFFYRGRYLKDLKKKETKINVSEM